ncbi:MAG: apolipoprotein N-acyltransferase, partial [Hyphomicrobiales bacterium]
MIRPALDLLLGLRGKSRAGVVFLLGALAALAMAPVHLSPVLFVSFPGFFLILNESLTERTPRQQKWMALWLGWCFGFGYFLA